MGGNQHSLRIEYEDGRIHYIQPIPAMDTWRPLGKGDTDKFSQWIERYRTLCSLSQMQKDLLALGREIHAWINGDKGLLDQARRQAAPPFLVEFTVPTNPDNAAKQFLEVPWEILADDAGFLAADDRQLYCPIRRLGKVAAGLPAPSPHWLSCLFMAASPDNAKVELDYEGEEVAILGATNKARLGLSVEESGTLPLLAERMAQEEPEVLHVSCHGNNQDGPRLALEDDRGGVAYCSPLDLARELGGHQPRLLFVSACRTGDPDAFLDSFSSEMVRRGIPAVLGWGGLVADSAAIHFAGSLYRYISHKDSLETALAWSRFSLLKPSAEGARPFQDWHLARLYLGPTGGGILASGEKGRKQPPGEAGVKEFLDAGKQVPVASRREFVGRRRQIQEILREFRDPSHAGVLISGLGNQGKSSLAARVANRLPGLKTVVLHRYYQAEDILNAIGSAVGTKEAHDKIGQAIQDYREDHGSLGPRLREILRGPCRQVEKNDAGDVIRGPVLLVIDDFEQALLPPADGEGLHRIKPELVETYAALIEAFASVRHETDSRLLITSRYRFSLPHQERDLAESLLLVPLHKMKPSEGAKQALAKTRGINEEERKNLTDERVRRCVEAALGNPGLQDLLFFMAAQTPEQCDQALDAMEGFIEHGREPDQQRLLDFLGGLLLDSLLGYLKESELRLLRASSFLSFPIPQEAFADLGLHPEGQEPGRRLFALGLWEEYPDLVNRSRRAVAINPLVNLKLEKLSPEEQKAAAARLLPGLFELWGGKDRAGLPSLSDIQLAQLALLAGDAEVLSATAAHAVSGLEKRFLYQAAAELGNASIKILESSPRGASVDLLLAANRVNSYLGQVGAADEIITKLLALPREGKNALGDHDLAAALHRQANALVRRGEPDRALEALERARGLLEGPTFKREQAVFLGDIARIRVSKGQVDEALKLHEERLGVFEELGDRRSRAVTLGDIARIRVSKGQVDEALKLHEERLGVFEELGDRRSRAVTLGDIARIRVSKGQVDEALKLHEERLGVFEELGDRRSRAVTLGDIARIRVSKGQVDEALKLHEERLGVFEELGDRRSRAVTLGDIARIRVSKGQVDEALKLHEERLGVFEELGDRRSRAVTLGDIARIRVDKGQVDEALKLHEEMLGVVEELGDRRSRAVTLGDIARIRVDKGQVDEALKLHEEMLGVFEELGDRRSRAVTLGDIARIRVSKGQVDEALKLHEERLGVFEELGDRRSRAVTLGDIARIRVSKGQVDEALKLHEEELKVYEELGDRRSRAVTLGDIARIRVSKGQVDEALKLHEERLGVFEELGDLNGKANALWSIAQIEMQRERYQEAYEHLDESYRINLKLERLDGICFVGIDLGQLLCMGGHKEEGLSVLDRSREGFIKLGQNEMARQVEALINRINESVSNEQLEQD